MPKQWTERDDLLLHIRMAISKSPSIIKQYRSGDAAEMVAKQIIEYLEGRGYKITRPGFGKGETVGPLHKSEQ